MLYNIVYLLWNSSLRISFEISRLCRNIFLEDSIYSLPTWVLGNTKGLVNMREVKWWQLGPICFLFLHFSLLQIGVRQKGCNGLTYTLDYATEKAKFDEEVEQVRIFLTICWQLILFTHSLMFSLTVQFQRGSAR